MREYERVCRCCSYRYAPSGEGDYCGPCGRARVMPEYPLDAEAAVLDKDWFRVSGHDCGLLWTADAQLLADRALARERRNRWPDIQREDYER